VLLGAQRSAFFGLLVQRISGDFKTIPEKVTRGSSEQGRAQRPLQRFRAHCFRGTRSLRAVLVVLALMTQRETESFMDEVFMILTIAILLFSGPA